MLRLASCLLSALVAGFVFVGVAHAQTSAQFAAAGLRVPNDPKVNGFRFSFLYGDNQLVDGLDMGIVSWSETDQLSGVALVLGISKVNGPMTGGAAFSLVNVHSGKDKGFNAAFVNLLNDAGEAWDLGFINVADGATMVDIGGVNVSKRSKVQLGFINVTSRIEGFQLGFINVADNGFLPVFPFFNFEAK